MNYASNRLQHNEQLIRTAFEHGLEFEFQEWAVNNKEIALLSVRRDGMNLRKFLPFFNDFDVVLAAVTQNGRALEFANPVLQTNDQIIRTAFEHGLEFQYWMGANKKISLLFVRRDGMNLRHFIIIPHNFDVVLAAVTQNGNALQFANRDLQYNDVIINVAMDHGLQFSRSYNGSDPLIALRVSVNRWKIENRQITIAFMRRNGMDLEFVYAPFRNDREVVLAAVTQNGMALQFAPYFQDDLEIIQAAVRQNPAASAYAKVRLNLARSSGLFMDLRPFRISLLQCSSESVREGKYLALCNLILNHDTAFPEAILAIPTSTTLSQEVVTDAFKKLSLIFHPDRNFKREKEATILAQCIGQAKELLLERLSTR